MLLLAGAMQLQATDIIFGNCHYREIEGRYAGYRKTESYTTFETDDRITLVYCLRIPRDSVSGIAGYALPPGEPVIAHIVLRNGASIVRKIMAK